MKVQKSMCPTCPWREGSPYAHLVPLLEESAFAQASRICHSTGSNAINEDTGKPEKLCRGARKAQLRFLVAIGFLPEATDQAWTNKCRELGIKQDFQNQHKQQTITRRSNHEIHHDKTNIHRGDFGHSGV